MQLSKRLRAVVDMVTCNGTVCDVGCDHGYVSITLIQEKICKKVIAMDVRTGPLERARQHISDYGLTEYIETRLSDGLKMVGSKEADAMICAGMGGRLMQKILAEGKEQIGNMQELILQPQSEIPMFRKFLKENGYHIADENIIWEDGKFYPILRVTYNAADEAEKPEEFSKQDWEILSAKYGPWLLRRKHPVLRQYLQFEYQTDLEILEKLKEGTDGERLQDRIRQKQEDQEEVCRVLKYMEGMAGDKI